MSGHSKWKTIQHKKGAADAKRGKVFSRISKEIMVSARNGGGSPDTNPSLRTLISQARGANMPADNIQRAIKKGTGEIEGGQLEEIVYEGYARGGVGLIVIALTDNKNRASADVRHIFSKHGTSLADQNAVARSFKRRGQIFVDASTIEEEKLMDIVLEAGADDMKQEGDQFEILTDPSVFHDVMAALEAAEVKTGEAEVKLLSDLIVTIEDAGDAAAVFRFISALEENDDVQNVYTNMDLSDDVLKQLEQAE
jgi:YebC/PmpR family DNA-binding regulatory protein